MNMRFSITPILILGLLSGCGDQSGGASGEVKDEKSPDYGLSVSEKLKRDLAADPATAKANASGTKSKRR